MGKLNQPHDKYFRSTFGETGFAKDFLSNYLPKELIDIIDISSLEPQPTSYISEDLREQFTDLLFRVNIMKKEAYIYFLFEHKSYRDRMVIFQVLKYMIAVWEDKIKEELDSRKEDSVLNTGDIEIPIVIPLVVYHDKHKWNIKRTLGEMIPNYRELPESVKKYIPDFEYMLSDLSYSDGEIGLDEEHAIIIRTLNQVRYATKDKILDVFREAISIFTKNKDKEMVGYYLVESMTYILNVREDISGKELVEIAGKISKEGGELAMTAAEKLRQEGREEGKEEGARIATIDNTLTLLTLKFGTIPNTIKEKLSELDMFTLKLIIAEIFSYESIDELDKYLK